jgi:amino-acid N-acetyltransferase
MNSDAEFVAWFRHASPYIHSHRAHTFVISFDGAAVEDEGFIHLIHDLALLNNLGIRVVLVHGTRHQIERDLRRRNQSWHYANGIRITDDTALNSAMAACGEIAARIQGLLSMGLANVPQMDPMLRDEAANIRLVIGNFITAKPVGVRDGIDFQHTGEVRRVDAGAIQRHLDDGNMVLVPPLGYSPSGEIFNLTSEDVATSVAIALTAAKWICLTENQGLRDAQGCLLRQMVLQDAQILLTQAQDEDTASQLRNAVRACANGVKRVHLVERCIDGGLLLELFSRDGIGTLISTDPYENLRKATVEDVYGIIRLIEPLEQAGILVRRSREKLEMEIPYFVVQERDGIIIACAALYPFAAEKMGELACLAVHENYRRQQRGDVLLCYMERQARQLGLERLFVLTTRTAHWFIERGFAAADISILPQARQHLYNYQRQSKVFVKTLVLEHGLGE